MKKIATVRTYGELQEALRVRADALNISRAVLNEISGLPDGYMSTLLAPAQRKRFGVTSLGATLQALGLALIVVEDPEAAARVRQHWGGRHESQVRRDTHWRAVEGA